MRAEEDLPKVLVVDDVAQNRLAMQALLADADVELLLADSGPAALECLLGHEVALALLDVQMPGMDGYALAELMRGADRTRHVPIIFLTAGAQEPQRSFRGYEAGAVDFLYKPLDPLVLRSKVAVFVDLHRQRRLLALRMAEHERLARVNAAMLASLTHDIRTPLAVLTLNAELLLRRAEASGLRDAGARIKAATVMLGRQVDHLVNLAHLPNDELRPAFERLDFAELVRARKAEAEAQLLVTTPFECRFDGDARGDFDAALLAEAVDHLLLLAAINADGAPVAVEVEGGARRAVLLRIAFKSVLSDAAAMHLFGGGVAVDGVASPRVGIALQRPERIARAHGGSLIGRSKEREGTMFELLLPRTTMR